MLVAHVHPADVIGESLRLHLGPTEWPAVASRQFRHDPFVITVEVLAASHRVLVHSAASITPLVVETVACGRAASSPVDDHRLPAEHELDLVAATYRFTSATRTGFHAVRRAADDVRSIERGLQVAFPGHSDALTGIRLDPAPAAGAAGSIGWTTHHVYPGTTPHVVTTSSTLTLHRRSA